MFKEPWGFRDRFFEQIEKEFSDAEDMLNRVFKTVAQSGAEGLDTQPYFYGYQVTVGTDGKPHIREFGNVRPSQKGLIEQSEVRQPLVDTSINEKENTMSMDSLMKVILNVKTLISLQQGTMGVRKTQKTPLII